MTHYKLSPTSKPTDKALATLAPEPPRKRPYSPPMLTHESQAAERTAKTIHTNPESHFTFSADIGFS